MNIYDLLEFSQISKRMWTQVHILHGVKQFKIGVNVVSEFASAMVSSQTDWFQINVDHVDSADDIPYYHKYDKKLVPVKPLYGNIITYWTDIVQGLISVLTHLIDLFNCTIDNIDINSLSKPQFLTFAEWLTEQELEIEELSISTLHTNCVNILVNHLKITDKLWIREPASGPEDVYNLLTYPKEIHTCQSPWFTRDILFESDSESMLLCHSLLNNEDLDGFVKKWKLGDFPNLKHIMVKSTRINNASTIDGKSVPIMNVEVREPNLVYISNKLVNLSDGVEIFSDNGRRGTLQVEIKTDVPSMFSIYVHD